MAPRIVHNSPTKIDRSDEGGRCESSRRAAAADCQRQRHRRPALRRRRRHRHGAARRFVVFAVVRRVFLVDV